MRHLLLLLLIGFIGALLPSCIEDDFTQSPSDLLAFSTDTLSFDTIFTDQGTPTARLKVYNRASKSINISAIYMKESSSMFQMNVDGQSGKRFEDVEIRGGDSIFVFVECKLPENQANSPVRVEDAIEFVTNGVRQQVVLTAWGQNVTRLKGERLTVNTRFTAERPIVVFDSLVVAEGATLSIDPGTQLLFHDKAQLIVKGRLEAIGAPGKMIDMRGDRLDNVLPDVSYDIMAGQWEGVRIAEGSYGNRLEYVNMRSTNTGLVLDSCANTKDSKLLIVNSWLHNAKGNVLEGNYGRIDAYGSVFSEAGAHVLSLTGGKHTFTQCTFANNYLFATSWQSIIGLYNVLDSEGYDAPRMEANFYNGIIYGINSELNIGDLQGSNVFMYNMLLGSGGSNDDNFIDCLWGEDPLFLTVRNDYYFNYRVQADSPAIGAGNPAYVTGPALIDMDGINRLSYGNPTLGAYQYVPAE